VGAIVACVTARIASAIAIDNLHCKPYDPVVTVTFETLTQRDRTWNLDEFVDEVNRALPQVVPRGAEKRAKLEVNARLVRHYTTEGALPRPLKDGVEARYDTEHFVRMLALRRLLLEGYPSGVAGALLSKHDRETLARFLLGELRLELELAPGGPPVTSASLGHVAPEVRERLSSMRARAGLAPIALEDASRLDEPHASMPSEGGNETPDLAISVSAMRAAPRSDACRRPAAEPEPYDPPPPASWARHLLLPGLELHLRDDFERPTTPAGWQALREVLLARLEAIALERPKHR
jgi:DNA-binding transcriptional MerR regulator